MKRIEKSLTSVEWWKAAGLRAVRTFAQALLASIPAAVVAGSGWGWVYSLPTAAGTAALAAFLSLVTSLAGLPEVE